MKPSAHARSEPQWPVVGSTGKHGSPPTQFTNAVYPDGVWDESHERHIRSAAALEQLWMISGCEVGGQQGASLSAASPAQRW